MCHKDSNKDIVYSKKLLRKAAQKSELLKKVLTKILKKLFFPFSFYKTVVLLCWKVHFYLGSMILSPRG